MTNENTTLERVRSADPVPSAEAFPHDAWSADVLLAHIDERSTLVTDLKTTPKGAPEKTRSWRGIAIAAAVAAAILVVVGITGLLMRSDGDIAPVDTPSTSSTVPLVDPSATPTEVVTAYLAAVDAGDVATYEALLDPEQPDLFTGVNGTRRSARYQATTGMVVTHDCSTDGTTVTCTTTRQSGLAPDQTYPPFEMIAVVEAGMITTLDFGPEYVWADNVDAEALNAYRAWVEGNRADAYDDLFGPTFEIILDTPDARALHGSVIAEYLGETG